jgi:energy-converting hydrogenase Eha subunit C
MRRAKLSAPFVRGHGQLTKDMSQPLALLVRLVVYFGVAVGGLYGLALTYPAAVDYLPVGGAPGLSLTDELEAAGAVRAGLTLAGYISGAVVAVVPITWVYMATRRAGGFKANFVRALVILPICATSTVLLVQDSLPLAFGLAALVAAIRFRVRLADPIDGIYILAAIAIGLGAGIGYVGVALVTSLFFGITATILWMLDYGRNPLEDEEIARKRAKHAGDAGSSAG